MKELDFDELDKAVNSLMANASVAGQKSEPSEKVLEVPTSSPVASTPSATPVAPTPTPTRSSSPTPTRPAPSAAPATRRGGRFMDVVHPSSTMKKEAPKPVNRQAATIQPSQDATMSAPLEAPRPTSEAPVEKPAPAVPEAPKNDWPDPLEMANFSGVDEKKEESASVKETASTAPEADVPKKQDEEAPLVSPFLPDTKVEKRPLGGNTSQSETPSSAPAVEDADDQLPATLEDTKPIMPEEFHSDLVAIEADTTGPQKKDEEEAPAWKSPSVDKPDADKKLPPAPDAPKNDKPSIPTGPTSIPQQYKEEKSTGDQENGAIYDTNAYHQPLSHPAKQKSGWMWVVWIVLILVVGAGGGAALYLLGIIR